MIGTKFDDIYEVFSVTIKAENLFKEKLK